MVIRRASDYRFYCSAWVKFKTSAWVKFKARDVEAVEYFLLPLPAPSKVSHFRVCFRFQLLSSNCIRFHKNLIASSFRFHPCPWTLASGGRGAVEPPWIFIPDTNIVDRGLKVLFFGDFLLFFDHFFRWPPWKRLNSAIFRSFCNFSVFFSVGLPWKLFVDALVPTPCFMKNVFTSGSS